MMFLLMVLGLLMPGLQTCRHTQQDRVRLDIMSIEGSLKLYAARNGGFPDTAPGLETLVEQQILDQVPQDAWNRDYVYVLENGRPIITSYGRDGVPGGEGLDADISNRPDKKQP